MTENTGHQHPLGAAHAELMGVEFDSWDAEREEIVLRFHAPDSFITPRGSVQGVLVAGFLDEVMGWPHVLPPSTRKRRSISTSP